MPFINSVRGNLGAGVARYGAPPKPFATGGTLTIAGGYRIHTFLNSQSGQALTFTAPPSATNPVEYMVVAGGGSGYSSHGSGGGGAGGY